jgi:alcohol dehydrogenase, propanol-preferring
MRGNPRERHSAIPLSLLWEERQILSVANLIQQDARNFLSIAPKVQVRTETVRYPLESANEALADLRAGRLQGAAVLVPDRQ